MTMHQALHPRDAIDRLHETNNEEGGRLARNENCMDGANTRTRRIEGLITEISNSKKKKKKKIKISTNQYFGEKQLYEYFKRQT